MAMRRRRFRRSFAGRSKGRNFFWIRQQPFTLSQRATTPHLILSDVIADEATWSDPSVLLNQTKKGAPRLERFILNYGFGIDANQGFFNSGGDANFNLIPEVMVHTQSDQFLSVVTSTSTFDSTLENQRVIMHEVPGQTREFQHYATTVADDEFLLIRTVQGHYETKSKVNLREKAIAIALRSNFDANVTNFRGFVDWFQPTMLISIP